MTTLKATYQSGQTVTCDIRNTAGQVLYVSGLTFEAYGASGHTASNCAIACTDKSGEYTATVPAGLASGAYKALFWDSTITGTPIYEETFYWDGSQLIDAQTLTSMLIGPGDHAVTLTIRTTTGTPVPGIVVCLSTTGLRESSVVVPATTNDAGLVTFNLNYTTYYIHCKLAGYAFLTASMTPAAGAVTQGYETAAVDNYTTTAVLKMTGECADGGDTITQTMWLVDVIN